MEPCSWPLKAFLPLFFPVINGGWIANAISVRRINIKRSSSNSDYPCSRVMIGVYRKVAVVEKSAGEVGRFSTTSSPVAPRLQSGISTRRNHQFSFFNRVELSICARSIEWWRFEFDLGIAEFLVTLWTFMCIYLLACVYIHTKKIKKYSTSGGSWAT